MRKRYAFAMFALAMTMLVSAGCDEAAEEALEAATGLDFVLNEDDADVTSPDGWVFLFGVVLDEEQSKLIDQEFEVPLDVLESVVDLDGIEYMLAFAKKESLEGYGNRLRYANKLKVEDKKLVLDTAAVEALGPSIGSSGEGLYIAYFAEAQNGYINGSVKSCDGSVKSGILATASDGPFFTYSADDGSWALPSLSGVPAQINFTDGDCSGSTSQPSTEDGEENPKDPEETPPIEELPDGTDSTDAGETELPPDGSGSGSTDGDCIALDTGWSPTGECVAFGVSNEEYDALFPDGDGADYLYATSSGSQTPSCTMSTTVAVPEGMTQLKATYNFLSQEWEEWAGSAYNDIFTLIVQGAPDYLVNRSVNNTASAGDWEDISMAILGIDGSADAGYNGTGAVYDGQLKNAGGEGVRGEPEEDNVGKFSTVNLPADMTTITVLFTVSDVGDAIYDSAGLVDSLCFQ
ncbi:MAG: choice-of-anchor L domain-containing protein [Deltaproteobacteria bacterium]|nr:choice-of-anchor L domain-containing protein [Deltaproteobacteria bacterium]